MVAVIKISGSIRKALTYNENKVEKGKAVYIGVSGYPKDLEELSFNNKLNRLVHQASLNTRVRKATVHISLNFDPSERLSVEKLNAITEGYMIGIGFGDQPYLVYQHLDTKHPHVHIVSIKIKEDGSRIETHALGRTKSSDTRRALESQFDLISPERKKRISQKALDAEKVIYGKMSTVASIENVVGVVLETYKYANLQEFNAVLVQYNVIAHQGAENSIIRKNNGLVYQILDQDGNKIGRPIKASELRNKPIMKLLEKRFTSNEVKLAEDKLQLTSAVDLIFLDKSQSLDEVINALNGIQINLVFPKRPIEDEIYYVDHRTKCVFSSNHLGEKYSKMGIVERFKQ